MKFFGYWKSAKTNFCCKKIVTDQKTVCTLPFDIERICVQIYKKQCHWCWYFAGPLKQNSKPERQYIELDELRALTAAAAEEEEASGYLYHTVYNGNCARFEFFITSLQYFLSILDFISE